MPANLLGDFSEARLLSIAPQRQVVLSFTNRIRLDFAHTWVTHIRNLGMTNFLVGATDQQAVGGLVERGIPCFSMQTNLPQGEWPWGSPSFKALGPHKIELIYKSISWGFEVVITDIDALVLREPFAYMARWPDAAFLTTSDHLGNTTNDDGLETHNGIHTAFNIGYMFFRKAALPLVEEWRRVIREEPRSRWDQGEFNRIARMGWDPRTTAGLSDPRLFYSYKKQLIGGVLNLALFAGGHNHFVSQFARRQGWQPYSVHTTYQYAAAAGKRHRLREGMVWIDDATYYDPPGGLLSYEANVPHDMVYPREGMDAAGHIALINHQLAQVRSALAVAYSLGRKLIMPRIVCGYDKAWYPLSSGQPRNGRASKGVFPGSHSFILPIFNCPIDHYLEVGMMDPVNTIREYSFLLNPRTPTAVKQSTRNVTLMANRKGSGVSDGYKSGEIARLRKETTGVKVVHLTNVATVDPLESVLSGAEVMAFRFKFRTVGGSWCCAPTHDVQTKRAPQSTYFRLLGPTAGKGRVSAMRFG